MYPDPSASNARDGGEPGGCDPDRHRIATCRPKPRNDPRPSFSRHAVARDRRGGVVSGGGVPAPPDPVPHRFDLSVVRPADGRALAVIVVAAAGTDLAVRSGIAVLAGALLVVTVAAGMLATRRLENPQA